MSLARTHASPPVRAAASARARPVARRAPPVAHAAAPARAHACACGGTCPRCAPAESAVQHVLAEPGSPLDAGVRQRAERQFGTDLSTVRIHTGRAAARAVRHAGANAFAAGRHVVFGSRMYTPNTTEGYRRLVHELTHVLQQSARPAPHYRLDAPDFLEGQARATAERVGADPSAPLHVAPEPATEGRVQREDPPLWRQRADLRHPWTSQGEFQFEMSPEIRRILWEIQFERWLAGQQELFPPPTAPGEPAGGEPVAEEATAPETPIVPSPTEAAETVEEQGPRPPRQPVIPIPGADFLTREAPDVGALMGPYLTRGVPLGARDADAAAQLYWNAHRWVRLLPDPPKPFRSWVPSDWRRSVAQALANAAIDNSPIRFDFPTPVEEFDRQILNFTRDPGTVPFYLNLPSIPFDFP